MLASRKRLEQAEAAKAAHDAAVEANKDALQQAQSEGAVGGEVIVGVSGRRIVLNEAEKQNPDIMAKYM